MTPPADPARDKHHRFPGEIIRHGVWLSSRCPLSDRDVQELLCERGSDVTHEAIRPWCRKFGQEYAHQLKRRRPRTGDKWHVDEVFLTINGQRHYLWRAVDQDDNVLDILVQSRRNTPAAKKCFRTLLKGCQYVPRVIITDKLKSDGAAKREGSCWIPGSWDVPMSYNPIVVTLASLKPFFFKSLQKELCFPNHAWSISPGIQEERLS